jgi:TonB family protein
MSARAFLLAVLFFAGCASTPETIVSERLPSPIGEVFLPVYPSEVPYSVRIHVRALILNDGSVRSAQISPRTGNDLWDSLAVLAIKSWHFSPALQNGRPVPAWIRFPVTLRFAEAHPIPLAEIVVSTRSLADSIYALVQEGQDFGALALRYSLGPTAQDSGYLGARPLKDFPLPVQMAITSVGPGQVTRPILVDGRYVIYKRLRKDVNS